MYNFVSFLMSIVFFFFCFPVVLFALNLFLRPWPARPVSPASLLRKWRMPWRWRTNSERSLWRAAALGEWCAPLRNLSSNHVEICRSFIFNLFGACFAAWGAKIGSSGPRSCPLPLLRSRCMAYFCEKCRPSHVQALALSEPPRAPIRRRPADAESPNLCTLKISTHTCRHTHTQFLSHTFLGQHDSVW